MGCSLRRKFVDFWCPFFQKKRSFGDLFFGTSILTPPFWIHSKNPLFGGGGLKLSSEITFHQVHKSGYSEVPPRQPANRIFLHNIRQRKELIKALEKGDSTRDELIR